MSTHNDPADDPFASATQLLAMLRAGEASSVELVERHLERIDTYDGELSTMVTVDREGALHAARRCDDERAEGTAVGALHGLPITLKDCFATAGLRTTAGKEDMADHVPDEDAVTVARLREAGAVVLAKTNLPAGVSGQETANRVLGRTVNPWSTAHTPGGSSGGAAAALAAGLSPLDLGSDSGGSIRQPAHCCGTYGHLATAGLIPQRGHLPSVPVHDVGAVLDMFSIGPMARHPADLALAMSVLVGDDPLGDRAWRAELPPPRVPLHGVEGVRVAVIPTHPACSTSRVVHEKIEAAAAALDAAGAHVDTAGPPFDAEHGFDVAFRLWCAANADDDDGEGGIDDELSKARMDAIEMTHGAWLELDEERRGFARAWTRWLQDVDVVICPVSPVPAVAHDPDPTSVDEVGHRLERTIDVDGEARPYLHQILWNVLTGMAGLPVTAVPLGRGPDGLPIGAQVVAAPHRDLTTIAFAGALSEVIGGFEAPPRFA